MEHAIIHLERKKGPSDLLRSYKVIIDDELAGTIRHGKSCSFQVRPGRHDIFLMIDWCSSQHLTIDIAPGEEIKLICQANSPSLWFNMPMRDYMKLYQEL